MVARNPLLGVRLRVNPLQLETAEERRLFLAGEHSRDRKLGQKSLFKRAPTAEESGLIHGLFLESVPYRDRDTGGASLPDNIRWLHQTRMGSTQVCHPQERNIHNFIFGGFLMRAAFELAFSTACVFARGRCQIVALHEITFHKPVAIGSILDLQAEVVFCQGAPVSNFLQVAVVADVLDIDSGSRHTTITFSFTFQHKERPLPKIIPVTYFDAIKFLQGQDHFRQSIYTGEGEDTDTHSLRP